MVQFGITLCDVVKSDWRCHAVAYIELKRSLTESHEAHRHHGSTGVELRWYKREEYLELTDAQRDELKGWAATQNNGPGEGVNIDLAASNDEIITTNKDNATHDDDAHSVHTESSYCVNDTQKAKFFRIYEDSIRRVSEFYVSRVAWAQEERKVLERLLHETRRAEDEKATTLNNIANTNQRLQPQLEEIKEDEKLSNDQVSSSLSTSDLIHQIKIFSRDLGLILEFLELNATAFSKIMKKYDKRTGSELREGKLTELKAEHSYLYDGGELRKYKSLCADWMKMASKLQSDVKMLVCDCSPGLLVKKSRPSSPHANAKGRRSSSSRLNRPAIGLSVNNSIVFDAGEIKKVMTKVRDGENPQESSEMNKKDSTIPEETTECLEVSKSQPRPAPRSIHQTKETVFVEKMIDHITEELCLQKADSPFFDNALELTTPPHFETSEVELAESLGQGEFCKIYEVSQFSIPETDRKSSFPFDSNNTDHEDEDELHHQTTRGFMKDHCLRNGEARYAIKRIRSDIIGQEDITDAAVDLAREAEFLAVLKHPNIIRIRGTINVPGHPKYSLILDRLYDTLVVQTKKWKLEKKRCQGKFKGLIGKNKFMLDKLWTNQLIAAYDLARAMAYLHSHGILHRDIKPANIGFDIRGDIKIFDFGLAKELKPSEREGEDQYNTDGVAGTRRYMAPEMAQVMPYGLSADVYSFGILVWEMLSLKHAFEKYNREKHYKYVVVEGIRPKVFKSWPFSIKNIVQRCWHKDPLERPTFPSICQLIKFGLSNDKGSVSCRSDDLLLRSYRSNHGRV
eukprot:CAMPEP_0196131622 /NCGR_PEP_ID=MMETSP0910-20130528/1549_1 /TAXON_ID=49265 /ORGANISM="Thalassiosira rotula, Strain GSO102" /LENGTH=795 /DNA_ID=CAMNT_0041391105 /DNA_START=41 /DNA_END=2428 /DNA_ORIENTATION=-